MSRAVVLLASVCLLIVVSVWIFQKTPAPDQSPGLIGNLEDRVHLPLVGRVDSAGRESGNPARDVRGSLDPERSRPKGLPHLQERAKSPFPGADDSQNPDGEFLKPAKTEVPVIPAEHLKPVPPPSDDPDIEFLRRMHVGTDGPSLIKFLEERSPSDVDPDYLEPLIRQLGEPSFEKREQATRRLAIMELTAVDALHKALHHPDKEIARRVQELTDKQDRNRHWGLTLTVVRQLAMKKAPGTLEALLRYLPFTRWDDLQEEIWYAIDSLAVRHGKVQPALVAALRDRSPARRAVAGCIIGRVGKRELKTAVRELLHDKQPMVRLRAAQGLLAGKDKAAIPVLIDLLDEPLVEISWQAEELLHWVAGEDLPKESVGSASEGERDKCRSSWVKWWNNHKAEVDFAKLEREYHRPQLLLILDHHRELQADSSILNRIWLSGTYGNCSWQFGKQLDRRPREPYSFQVCWLPSNQFLVVDGAGYSLFDLRGQRKWEKENANSYPWQQARLLGNGKVLLALGGAIGELDVQGREKPLTERFSTRLVPVIDIGSDGRIYGAQAQNFECVEGMGELDLATGGLVSATPLPARFKWPHMNFVQVLPGGSFLAWREISTAADIRGEVLEIDYSGRVKWRYDIPEPRQCMRLRNGNTLILNGSENHRNNHLSEVDRRGKVVWEGFSEYEIDHFQVIFPLLRFGFDRSPGIALDSLQSRLEGLKSKNVPIRRWSARSWKPGWNSESAIAKLIEALHDPDVEVRKELVRAIANIGPKADKAIPAIVRAFNDQERKDWQEISDYLVKLGPQTIPHLLMELSDPDPVRRSYAIGDLVSFASQEDKVIQETLKSNSVYAAIVRAVGDENAGVRRIAIMGLGAFKGNAPDDLVAIYRQALIDKNPAVVEAAISALEFVGPEAQKATPDLYKLIENPTFCERSAWTLVKIETDRKRLAHVLHDLVQKTDNKDIRASLIVALGRCGKDAEISVPTLIALLKTTNFNKRDDKALAVAALVALGDIGSGAKAAVPVVWSIVQTTEKDRSARVIAISTLEKIDTEMADRAKKLILDEEKKMQKR
jgi:HEAT repeat protein